MPQTNIVKKIAGYVTCGNGVPMAAGDAVRLFLDQTAIPSLPEYVDAVVQNPVLSTTVIDTSCACAVDGTCYIFRYDTDDLPSGVNVLTADMIESLACITCCEINADRFSLLEEFFGSTLAYAATLDWDEQELDRSATLTLTGDAALNTITNATVGVYSLLVIQDGTGGHDLTIGLTGIGKSIEIAKAADARTVVKLHYDGTSYHLLEARNEDRVTDLEVLFGETLTYAAVPSWDRELLGRSVTLTLTGNALITGVTNALPGRYSVLVIQDGVGGHTLSVSVPGLTKILELNDAAAGRTVIFLDFDGTNWHLVEALHESRITALEAGGNVGLFIFDAANVTAIAGAGTPVTVSPDQFAVNGIVEVVGAAPHTQFTIGDLPPGQEALLDLQVLLIFNGDTDGKNLVVFLDVGGTIYLYGQEALETTPSPTNRGAYLNLQALVAGGGVFTVRLRVINATDTTNVTLAAESHFMLQARKVPATYNNLAANV